MAETLKPKPFAGKARKFAGKAIVEILCLVSTQKSQNGLAPLRALPTNFRALPTNFIRV